MGGAQFALPSAVERLRAARTGQESGSSERGRTLVLAAADPAQPYGAALPWPKREQQTGSRPPRTARVAGAYVVLLAEQPVLYVERGGRGLVTLSAQQETVRAALGALAEAVRGGVLGKLALERIDGEAAIGSRWETPLADIGFRTAPRRLELSA